MVVPPNLGKGNPKHQWNGNKKEVSAVVSLEKLINKKVMLYFFCDLKYQCSVITKRNWSQTLWNTAQTHRVNSLFKHFSCIREIAQVVEHWTSASLIPSTIIRYTPGGFVAPEGRSTPLACWASLGIDPEFLNSARVSLSLFKHLEIRYYRMRVIV